MEIFILWEVVDGLRPKDRWSWANKQILYRKEKQIKIDTKTYLQSKNTIKGIPQSYLMEPALYSKYSSPFIYAFGANTCAGIKKPDNEDKILITSKVNPPPEFTGKWPEIHFFGIYDGHGGQECSEFLK